MKPNPILDELWKVKDELAAEAGYDAARFLENLRQWEADHPQAGQALHSAEDLRAMAAEEGRKRAELGALALKEEPPGN
jgi:hypothetical protein